MTNHYDVLGVPQDATQKEIKKAYRKKAQVIHPDRGGGEEAFKRLGEAYRVLSSVERRSAYDRGVDTSDPKSINALATGLLAALFQQIAEGAVESTDAVAVIRKGVRMKIQEIEHKRVKAVMRIKKYKKLKKRVKYKGDGIDIFSGVLTQGITHAEQARQQFIKDREVHTLILKLLEDYEVAFDAPQNPFSITGYIPTSFNI